jgi:hypothetical protein
VGGKEREGEGGGLGVGLGFFACFPHPAFPTAASSLPLEWIETCNLVQCDFPASFSAQVVCLTYRPITFTSFSRANLWHVVFLVPCSEPCEPIMVASRALLAACTYCSRISIVICR